MFQMGLMDGLPFKGAVRDGQLTKECTSGSRRRMAVWRREKVAALQETEVNKPWKAAKRGLGADSLSAPHPKIKTSPAHQRK